MAAVAWITVFSCRVTTQADEPRINEFLAINRNTIRDTDGDAVDWIEIHHRGPKTVNLRGWFLTDRRDEPSKWRFPAVEMRAGDYLLVFASGKNRASIESPLHTNFKLDGNGEYLALVRPGGTPASEFSPQYSPQRPDISFGTGRRSLGEKFVKAGDVARVLIPTARSQELRWTGTPSKEPFDDSRAAGWTSLTTGLGYVSDDPVRLPPPAGWWTLDGNTRDGCSFRITRPHGRLR